MLKTIMSKQKAFQERLGYKVETMTDEERAVYMRDQRGYLEDELAEALYEMPLYKRWKDYSKMTAEDKRQAWGKVQMELIDALHFFTNLLLGAGLTAEEVMKLYMAKNKENIRRQEDGYTADVSYRSQPIDAVKGQQPSCMVTMDDTLESTDDFIAILSMQDNRIALRYNTDALTMGSGIKLLIKEYLSMLECLDDEDRKDVESVVGEVTLREVTQ